MDEELPKDNSSFVGASPLLVRHSSRIMHLLECVFILEHCIALRWRVAHLG